MPARVVLRSGVRVLGLLLQVVVGVACGSEDGTAPADAPQAPAVLDPGGAPPGSDDPAVAEKLAEKPWEVVSNKGETLLTNVFYADASENEQIMPYALEQNGARHVMIDRLVYPTLGNPNLYTKNDPKDQLVVVLRIEDEAYAHLHATTGPVAGSPLGKLAIANDPATGFAFLLVPRGAREDNTESTAPISSGNGTGVIRIYPNDVLVNPIPADMPAVLQKRKTLRFVFKENAMKNVPPGLYDLRFEIRQDNDFYKPAGSASGVYEYQYNAVRVFDAEPEEHAVINITDTQVSVGSTYDARTKDRLSELVQFLNTTSDPDIRRAAFVTFNGDLHNGGSPGSLRQRPVARTYNEEAKAIVDTLKYLPIPIFLTPGNHDGYVATGHVPSAVKAVDTGVLDSLKEVVADASPKAWPGFDWNAYQAYLDATEAKDALGGLHEDIFLGSFARTAKGTGFADGWKEVPRAERNYILYDGFYQWQKTYGPLSFSWKFGKTFYVSMNSYELRQHRRSGWGMYTVNYGGGMSDVQLAWVDRELLRAKVTGDDVILLAHHDPRGGHDGVDAGYYFEQLEYRSVYQSAINFLVGSVWDSAVCKLPPWALSRNQDDKCTHDGLQEWMRPDEELDCAWDERKNGVCDPALFDPKNPAAKPFYFSGVELMKRVVTNPQVRTMLLGHTHYNQLEVLQSGDELLPGQLPIATGGLAQKFATLEIENPVRAYSFQERARRPGSRLAANYDERGLPMGPIAARNERFGALIDRLLPTIPRTLDGPGPGTPRELLVLRLVSNADLTSQTLAAGGGDAFGFGVLHLTKRSDTRAYTTAQINRASFFVNRGSNVFTKVKTIDLDRTARMRPHDADNPIEVLYDW